MCPIAKGPHHGPAPIPEEGRWVKAYQISDISGLSHGIVGVLHAGLLQTDLECKGRHHPEALVETLGLLGYDHSARWLAKPARQDPVEH